MEAKHEILLRQYESHVDLYKFYVNTGVKLVAFVLALSGALVSFYLTNDPFPYAKYALVLPAVLCVLLGGVYLYGARLMGVLREDMFLIRDALGFETAPEFQVGVVLLRVFSLALLITAIGLVVLIFVDPAAVAVAEEVGGRAVVTG